MRRVVTMPPVPLTRRKVVRRIDAGSPATSPPPGGSGAQLPSEGSVDSFAEPPDRSNHIKMFSPRHGWMASSQYTASKSGHASSFETQRSQSSLLGGSIGGLELSMGAIERDAIEEGKKSDGASRDRMAAVDHSGAGKLQQDVLLISEIGRGASSTVHLGVYIPTLRLVAVKEQLVVDQDHEKRLMEELDITHRNLVPIARGGGGQWRFDHQKAIGTVHPCPYVVGFYGAWASRDALRVSLVVEYMDSGSLDRVVRRGGTQSEAVLRRVAFCCLRALAHLQRHRTVHRDIKPANLLVSSTGVVKVADLGVAAVAPGPSPPAFTERAGTFSFFSPERARGEPYGYAADVWALGVSLIALCTGRVPFSTEGKIFGVRDQILQANASQLLSRYPRDHGGIRGVDGKALSSFSTEFQSLVAAMLTHEAKSRPLAEDLVQRDFFKGRVRAADIKLMTAFSDEPKSRPKSVFRREWESAMGVTPADGRSLLRDIKRAVVSGSDRRGSWVAHTVNKLKSRSQRDLMSKSPSRVSGLPDVKSLRLGRAYTSPPATAPRRKPDSSSESNTSNPKSPPPLPTHSRSPRRKDATTGTGYSEFADTYEVPLIRKITKLAATTTGLDQQHFKDKRNTTQSLGEGSSAVWEAFQNLAKALGLPRTEIMKELKMLQSRVLRTAVPPTPASTPSVGQKSASVGGGQMKDAATQVIVSKQASEGPAQERFV